jgi:Tol biopolymer transport system component
LGQEENTRRPLILAPDGQWIVFAAGNTTDNRDNDMFVMQIDGSQRRQLTDNPYPEYQPRWGR